MKRNASALWKGGLKDGHGTLSTDSGVLSDTKYSFTTRFEGTPGTNPEELIAAAHAGCFSMALSAQLEKEGLKADYIKTSAAVTLEKLDQGFSITTIHLTVAAKIANATQKIFDTVTHNAKEGCPVSKLMNAKITMDAKLED